MKRALLSVFMLGGLLGGCVTANVDEMTFDAPVAGMADGSIVVLGRRHAPDYDTEPDFIDCIGNHISRGSESISVCLLYTSPSPRDNLPSRMPSSA